MLIPIVGFVIWIIVSLDLAKSFGRGTGFGIGLALPRFIFAPILGFGSDTYKGRRRQDRVGLGPESATEARPAHGGSPATAGAPSARRPSARIASETGLEPGTLVSTSIVGTGSATGSKPASFATKLSNGSSSDGSPCTRRRRVARRPAG